MALRSMTFFNFLLESTLIGGALTVLVCILRHFFRVRLGSKLIYAAWLIVALRLLLPLSLPNPLMNEFRPTLSADADARPVADQVRTRFIDATISLTRADERGFSPIGALGAQTIHGNAGRWVLLCYAFVGLSAAGCMVWRHERFRLRVSRDRASVLEGDALETYQTLCARWRVKPIPVYYVDGLHAQCTVGVRRPFIALPLGLPRDRLVPALTHEICHRRAGDSLWAFLRDLCCVLHWLNPLVWLAAQLSRADAELACDECATPALTPTERAAYAALLQSEQENRRAGLCVLATGVRFQGKALARRVEAVLCAERPCKRATAMSVVLGVCVLILSFATSESAPLPAPSYVPVVAWAASEVALDTPEEAIAYARRFLESEFIDEDTSAMGFEANVLEDGWRVYATMKGHALPLTLAFSPTGEIYEYDGLRVLDDVIAHDLDYAHHTFTESMSDYLAAFVKALLPDRTWAGGYVTDDRRSGDMRFVNAELDGGDDSIADLICVQVEPVTRILYYCAGGSISAALQSSALDVERIAASYLTEVMDFSNQAVDAGTFECVLDAENGKWLVRYSVARNRLSGLALNEVLNGIDTGTLADAQQYGIAWEVDANGAIRVVEDWGARNDA